MGHPKVIAEFKLVFMKADAGYFVTNHDWYYFTGSAPPTDSNGTEWYEESYIADGWTQVTSNITPNPAWTAQSPSTGAIWIWSPNFNDSTSIDTPVYLRSMTPIPRNASIELEKYVSDDGTT